MNIAIVDDIKKERETLIDILNEYSALNQISIGKSEFDSAESFLSDYKPYYYSFIFLDIYMDEMNGIEAAKKIRTLDPEAIIIFLTTSDEHMPEAFSVHAFDYIAKPAHKDRVFKLLDEILKKKTSLSNEPVLSFSCEKNQVSLPYSRICLIRTSNANYLEIIDSGKKSYTTRMTFSSVCDELSSDPRFIQVIRGILVNMDHIVKIEDAACVTDADITVPVNVKRADEMTEIIRNYKFKKIRAERRERRNRN